MSIIYIKNKAELIEILRENGILVNEEIAYHPFPIHYPKSYVLRLLSNARKEKEKEQIRNLLISNQIDKLVELPDINFGFFTEKINNMNPLKGLTRGYVDRVLISPVGHCAVNCAWCFRIRQKGILNDNDLENILNYIKEDKRIEDVILTGGEPLLFPVNKLEEFLSKIREIPHVRIIRFHTRLPIVAPEYFDDELVNLIGEFNRPGYPVYLVVQIVHPLEINQEVAYLIYRFARQGITTLNQAPVLKGVNDDQETFNQWHKKMIHVGIKPYYVIVPIIRPGYNDAYFVPYSKVVKLVAEYSSQYDGLGRPTVIVPVVGRKISTLELKEAMVEKQGINFRYTKAEIW